MSAAIQSDEKSDKVLSSLVKHVYLQGNIAMIASCFCAAIIFAGLYNVGRDNTHLLIWSGIFLAIAVFRAILFSLYKSKYQLMMSMHAWHQFYILGSFLGGLSWGLVGAFLFPEATTVQQTLVILMVAGVSAGVVPLSAAIPSAAIIFLLAAILPLIVSIAEVQNKAYFLFDIAVPIYLVYTIVIMIKTHALIKNSIILKFENDALLHTLEVSNKNLALAATHDPLTHVANRRLFESNLKKAINRAIVSQSKLALFYIDLDSFKLINDTYGHHVGDHILMVVIGRLKNFFRKEDLISRLGGDEFAVILEYAHSTAETESIAARICQLTSIPIEINQTELQMTASVGVALYPEDAKDEEALIRCADKRMYHAKERGGNCFYLDDVATMPTHATSATSENRDPNR